MLKDIKYISLIDFKEIGINTLGLSKDILDSEIKHIARLSSNLRIYKNKDSNDRLVEYILKISEGVYKITEYIFSLNPDVDNFIIMVVGF